MKIPERFRGMPVRALKDSLCEGAPMLEAVLVPSSVRAVGLHAFKDCISLTELAFPKALRKIESYAFGGCTSLEKVVLENPQTEIAWRAFRDCPKLKDSPDPEAVQERKGKKMIEEQLKQEEEYLRKERVGRLEMIRHMFK